ncbi:tubby-related protein 4 [Spodoptera litura]|uniref:Tubby-related protein 4 n=1 Tax=Spodoptera litura TaxID=69820 RepID=A0A9J7E6W0_SPOLT|nr:tubby-related protein 4 [Spodoptera litura]
MHLHFERNVNAKCDCSILSLSWMGKVPDELPEEEGWKLNRNNYYQEGWLATGNVRGVVGVTFTSSHARRPHELPLRTNYNLRGHRSDVILVKWNEPYQKLASCDSSGVIFVWIKYEGRWSIELINDRSTPVTHFSWSHDGRMALICYQDGFVLVGSVAGQRYWSSMLSLDARITCGCWTPDDNQVYLGTASAQLVVMDVHGAMVSQVQLVAEGGIISMAWSCEKFKMEEGEETGENNGGHVLAVALGSGEIVLLRGHDDVSPVRVSTGLRGNTLAMEWANSRELLAVAGTLIAEADEQADSPPYKNVVKFYSDTGALIYTVPIPYSQGTVRALTWGHCARRLFVVVLVYRQVVAQGTVRALTWGHCARRLFVVVLVYRQVVAQGTVRALTWGHCARRLFVVVLVYRQVVAQGTVRALTWGHCARRLFVVVLVYRQVVAQGTVRALTWGHCARRLFVVVLVYRQVVAQGTVRALTWGHCARRLFVVVLVYRQVVAQGTVRALTWGHCARRLFVVVLVYRQVVAQGTVRALTWGHCARRLFVVVLVYRQVVAQGTVRALTWGHCARRLFVVVLVYRQVVAQGTVRALTWGHCARRLFVVVLVYRQVVAQGTVRALTWGHCARRLFVVVLVYRQVVAQGTVRALTWGHCARRLFVVAGGAVCTARVWRVVAPLQLLARVRAAQALRDPRLAPRLPLPPRLQPALANLFAHTIRCNVPETNELRLFVSRPPAAGGRLHCTMLRHDDEEAGAYTLYLEHLGGLVPLLKGRRTSKIRPEFVIFDPQAEAEKASSSSSSSSSSGATSSSSGGGTASPRTPRAARPRPRHALHGHTSSSDTEREEGCSGSPRLQRRRRARERRKVRNSSEKEDTPDELAYIDSLPEDVRLVEVTSNIWGTKFKMHGLAKNVPANLGQVTYKTSLLHLQPRQMTLMITELRDDYPVGPDPNFNPNIFSEDEEEVFQSNDSNDSPSHTNNNIRRKLTLNERLNNTNNSNQNDSYAANNNNQSSPSLARAESYDEFPYIDTNTNETVNNVPETVYSAAVRHASQAERRVSNTAGVPNRHAISPLRCESSVPTLQSPKNAVAPTDIIFERPSPQTVTCGGRGDFCGGRTDYSVRGDNVSLKGNLSNIEQQSFNLNLSLEPSRQVTIKKCDNHVTDNCLSKLRKNICSRGESASYDMNTRILKSLCNKNYEHEVHPDALSKRGEAMKHLQKSEDLKFIDEETPVDTTISNLTDKAREVTGKVQRTTTVVPISPVCATIPVYDTMTRSCSVGYLDLVDPQVLHAQVSLTALRGEPPRRLVLVNNKRHRRQRRHVRAGDSKQAECTKTPSLRRCGKSRSLDSSEMSLTVDKSKRQSRVDTVSPKAEATSAQSSSRCTSAGEEYSGTSASDSGRGARRAAGAACSTCRGAPPVSSAPASPRPRPAREHGATPAPAPHTPQHTPPRRHRYSSASPIRQLLNSPLLNRRRNKKPSESSDDEYSTGGGYSEVNGKNYRDLESFQKAQLRNKLKRAGGVMSGSSSTSDSRNTSARRQLVMHNKAPMWNENSQVYQLDFGGRVTQESAKNFQIEYHGKQVMQFGRIDGNAYTLDFQYPFSALQAFAVALANVTQRLK